MVWSPLSEIPMIGRSPTYVLTLFVFVFFNFPVIYAKNFGMFLAFRFLTGFIGSPALATGAASMGDIWSPTSRDYMIGIWGMFAISAPVLGPMLGGFAFSAKGWTWTIWQLLWVSAFTFVLLFLCLPETFAPNILARRARRVRRITGNSQYMAESELEIKEVKPKVCITYFQAKTRFSSKMCVSNNDSRTYFSKLLSALSNYASSSRLSSFSTFTSHLSMVFSIFGLRLSQLSLKKSTDSILERVDSPLWESWYPLVASHFQAISTGNTDTNPSISIQMAISPRRCKCHLLS